MLGDVTGRHRHRRTQGVRASFRLQKQRGNRADHNSQGDEESDSGWRWRQIVLPGRGAAAISFGLGDDVRRTVLRLRLMHRTRPVVRAASHACFGRRHPAGTGARLARAKHEGHENGREPVAEAQHPSRMRGPALTCQIAARRRSPKRRLAFQPKDASGAVQDDQRDHRGDNRIGDIRGGRAVRHGDGYELLPRSHGLTLGRQWARTTSWSRASAATLRGRVATAYGSGGPAGSQYRMTARATTARSARRSRFFMEPPQQTPLFV
jgi:hypothetical protein